MGQDKENTNKDRVRDEASEPIPYARLENVKSFWRSVAGGCFLAVIVTLFVALGVSYRDYAKSVSDNLRGLSTQWNKNFEKLADRVYEIERQLWRRKK